MRLFGKDIDTTDLLTTVNQRLFARGLTDMPEKVELTPEGVEARVDPMTFSVSALGEHADTTRGLPLETHRAGVTGRAVLLAKTVFRRAGQLFINEALGRQVVFNSHVRDSYAQLSAEVLLLRRRVAQLEQPLTAKASQQGVAPPQKKTSLRAPATKRRSPAPKAGRKG